MEYSTTCCISICDVYGESNPKIPEGYKQIDFRPYKTGEFFRLRGGGGAYCAQADDAFGRPYIILEKLPPKPEVISTAEYTYISQPRILLLKNIYGSSVQVPIGYKYVAFRPPTQGEYFIALDFSVELACNYSHGNEDPRIIVEKV